MATNFPTNLDALTNPTSSDGLNSPDHAAQHANANDAIEALQAKVGKDASLVTSSLDYKINNINANNITSGTLPDARLSFSGTGVSTGDVSIEMGGARTASGNCYIDMHAANSTDFESRILRLAGVNGDFSFTNTGTGTMSFEQGTNAPINFKTNSTSRIYVDTSGRVGVNTTSPAHSLHVVGDARVTSNLTVDGGLQIDTNTLFVDATNNRVGVGTVSPGATLDVQATSGTAMRITNTGTGNSFVVEDSASTDTSPFVIDANGAVGIGTTTVTAGRLLDVVGGTIRATSAATQDGIALSGNSNGTSNRTLTIFPNALSGNRQLSFPDINGEGAVFVSGRGTNTAWTTYTTTITQLGNVTFGTYVSRYCQIGKLIHWEFALQCSSAGTINNAIRVNLPQTAQGNATYSNYGTMHVYDANVNTHYIGHAFAYSTTQAAMMLNGGNTYFQTIALASGDIISGHIIYEAA